MSTASSTPMFSRFPGSHPSPLGVCCHRERPPGCQAVSLLLCPQAPPLCPHALTVTAKFSPSHFLTPTGS